MKQLRKRHHLIVALVILGLTISFVGRAQSDDEGKDEKSKMRQRLEQLFIWRVSDRLDLTTEEEEKFNEEYKKLSEERAKVTQKTDHILDQLSKEKTDKGKGKLLGEYEDALKDANLQLKELTAMKKIFDSKQLADYVLLKRDMFHKFRNVLISDTSAAKSPGPKAPIKEPQVFQEK
jgi:hypothetical protein